MMFNVINHQRNANENYNEIPPYTSTNGYYQYINKYHMLVRMWRKENTSALLVGMQIGAATVESRMELPKKI